MEAAAIGSNVIIPEPDKSRFPIREIDPIEFDALILPEPENKAKSCAPSTSPFKVIAWLPEELSKEAVPVKVMLERQVMKPFVVVMAFASSRAPAPVN